MRWRGCARKRPRPVANGARQELPQPALEFFVVDAKGAADSADVDVGDLGLHSVPYARKTSQRARSLADMGEDGRRGANDDFLPGTSGMADCDLGVLKRPDRTLGEAGLLGELSSTILD